MRAITLIAVFVLTGLQASAWGQNAGRCADVSGSIENLGQPFPDNPPAVQVRNPRLSFVFFGTLDVEDHAPIRSLVISARKNGTMEMRTGGSK